MKNWRNGLVLAVVGIAATRAVAVYRRKQRAAATAAVGTQPASTPQAPSAQPAPDLDPVPPLHGASGSSREIRHTTTTAMTGSIATVLQPRRLPEGTHLSQVHFGDKGAAKDRRKRSMARVGIAALVLSLLGVPGANLGLDLLRAPLNDTEPKITNADLGGVTTSESAESLMKIRGNLFQSRPTPTPTPTEEPEPEPEPEAEPAPEPAPPAGSVSEILYAAAAEFGLDGAYLVSVASCESGLNPAAVNPAGYHGLFQFAESTWASYGYGSIYDPAAQARTAARMLASGMASHWPNCA